MEDIKAMINILYEDNHIIVVEKPINMPVQKDDSNDIDLSTTIKLFLKEKYNKPGNVYLGLVHRLDRPVGGIMVFAKTSKAATRLSKQFRDNEVKKIYNAVVVGKINKKGQFTDYLKKNHHNNIVSVCKYGKEASLSYQSLKCIDNLSLVEIHLETGRSHQIRVQFSSHGYPLYGDHKYNKNVSRNSQLALFSKKITFMHPITKNNMTFELSLPKRYPFNIF